MFTLTLGALARALTYRFQNTVRETHHDVVRHIDIHCFPGEITCSVKFFLIRNRSGKMPLTSTKNPSAVIVPIRPSVKTLQTLARERVINPWHGVRTCLFALNHFLVWCTFSRLADNVAPTWLARGEILHLLFFSVTVRLRRPSTGSTSQYCVCVMARTRLAGFRDLCQERSFEFHDFYTVLCSQGEDMSTEIGSLTSSSLVIWVGDWTTGKIAKPWFGLLSVLFPLA